MKSSECKRAAPIISNPSTSLVLLLSQHHLSAITAHAEQVYPEECCGLMLGKIDSQGSTTTKSVFELAALTNHWTPDALTENVVNAGQPSYGEKTGEKTGEKPNSKHRRYHIDPKDMLRVQKQAREQGLSIIGVYHSHPDHVAEPSECDRALAWPEYAYVIVSVHGPDGNDQEGHGKENAIKAVDVQNWALDSEHQFQPEAIRVSPSSARDRMPVSA